MPCIHSLLLNISKLMHVVVPLNLSYTSETLSEDGNELAVDVCMVLSVNTGESATSTVFMVIWLQGLHNIY